MEHRSQQREEQLMCGLLREMHRNAVHLPEEERADGEEVVLIAFCSLSAWSRSYSYPVQVTRVKAVKRQKML